MKDLWTHLWMVKRMENNRFSSIRPRSFRAQFVGSFTRTLYRRDAALFGGERDEARRSERRRTGEVVEKRQEHSRDSWQPVAKGHARSSRRSCTRRLVVGGYRDVLILPRVPRGEIDTHRDPFPFPFLPLSLFLLPPSSPMFSRAMG